MKLNVSRVLFDPNLHKYYLDGVELSGITPVLSKHIVPGKYDNVSKEVLEVAKNRGTEVHQMIESYEAIRFTPDTPELLNYCQIKEEHHLTHEDSEYLVSDNEHFASSIDLVFRESDDEFTLADIKTTYSLDRRYIKWQLSIYAYLFELQNPGAKATRLAGIWLRGEDYKFEEVERIPVEVIKELLQCELDGRPFIDPTALPTDMPQKYLAIEAEIKMIKKEKDYWTQKEKDLREGIMKEMVLAGAYKWQGEEISFTRVAESSKAKFDEAAFKKAHPDLYKEFLVEKPTSGYVKINI